LELEFSWREETNVRDGGVVFTTPLDCDRLIDAPICDLFTVELVLVKFNLFSNSIGIETNSFEI
jgi:hypothetical protein